MSDNISQDVAIRGEGNIVVGKGDVVFNPIPPAEARLRHDLGVLVKNVENTWINGVLEKSVHEAALLELGMELREEAIDNPWRMVMERPDQSREALPHGRKIKDIFDEANRLLLILGEPGSGKTTTLLQLARDLIAEVDEAFTQPIPVILNLSTWTDKRQPLDEWLIGELNSKYRLPKKDGKKWLTDRRILPLLDGLDEVKVENRAACVEKVNKLVNDYGLQGLVVCSRVKDYTDLDVRLAFYRAIYLQPLTPEQVDKYLKKDKLADLRATLQNDGALQEMAQSPLILNIMSLAYQDTSSEKLSDPELNTREARIKHLFDTYINRMFNRKGGKQDFEPEQTKQRLSWLARNMQLHNQDVFLMENLQPSWLQSRRWRFIYTLASRLLGGLSIGLIIGLIWGLIGGLTLGLFWGLIGGLIWGLGLGLFNGLIFEMQGNRKNLMNDIKTVEALRWDWSKALKGGLISGLVGGLILLLIVGLSIGRVNLFLLLVDLMISGLFFGPVGAVFFGLSPEIIETKTTPNQGIRLSIGYAIVGGLIVGLSLGLVSGIFVVGLINEPSFGLSAGLIFGLFFGLVGALWYGGLHVIQHYTLRLILIIQGHTPCNYARFLDYAVDHIFLQKVAGGYRFIHRMLLEHFANMQETE